MSDRLVSIRDAAKARGDHNLAAEAQDQLRRMGYQESPDDIATDASTSGSEAGGSEPGGVLDPPADSSETTQNSTPLETVTPPRARKAAKKTTTRRNPRTAGQ